MNGQITEKANPEGSKLCPGPRKGPHELPHKKQAFLLMITHDGPDVTLPYTQLSLDYYPKFITRWFGTSCTYWKQKLIHYQKHYQKCHIWSITVFVLKHKVRNKNLAIRKFPSYYQVDHDKATCKENNTHNSFVNRLSCQTNISQ